jgi:hypothetical protein
VAVGAVWTRERARNGSRVIGETRARREREEAIGSVSVRSLRKMRMSSEDRGGEDGPRRAHPFRGPWRSCRAGQSCRVHGTDTVWFNARRGKRCEPQTGEEVTRRQLERERKRRTKGSFLKIMLANMQPKLHISLQNNIASSQDRELMGKR